MEARQSYEGGMNQDLAVSKRPNNLYYSGSNWRLITNEGTSSGALVNEKGTKLTFTVPNIAKMDLADGTIIPAQNNLQIIGGTARVDDIIIFTTNETSENPDGYGQVWKIDFDPTTDSFIGLTAASELDVATHLKYNNKVNFSTEYRIGRVIALYETSEKDRVYWTDNYNEVRTLNLADSDVINTPLENIDIFPANTLTQPTILSVGSGSLPTGVQVQFAYRLLDLNGGTTVISPASTLVGLPAPDLDDDFQNVQGSGNPTITNKSVTYKVVGVDTDYDIIQHYAVVYSQGSISVYFFDEQTIPADGNLEVTCTDISDAETISLEEYSVLSSGFTKAKDIEVQGNRLIAANIHTDSFEVDFDARVYRFNSGTAEPGNIPTARPGTSADPEVDFVELLGTSPAYASVPEEHDAVNVYNNEESSTWYDVLKQYKYQADGATLGGSGINISYTFTTKEFPANTNQTHPTITNHIEVPLNSGTSPETMGVLEADGTAKEVYKEGQYDSYRSAWAPSNYTGYARGEVYRFGIVFYNLKGVPSFVKWIGDIKFPDVMDGYPLQNMPGNSPELSALGIEFTVDTSSIDDQISGYSIVRVERENNDCTRLGTGYYMIFDTYTETNIRSLIHTYDQSLGGSSVATNPFSLDHEYNIYGVNDDALHLPDKPGYGNSASNKHYGFLVSPLGQLQEIDFKNGDYIETLGYYNSTLANYSGSTSASGDDDKAFGFYYKLETFAPNPHDNERFEIEKLKVLNTGEYLLPTDSFLNELQAPVDGLGLVNGSYSRNSGITASKRRYPLGIGSKKIALQLALTNPSIQWGVAANLMNWQGPQYDGPDLLGTTITWSTGQVADQKPDFKQVGYRRYLTNQYGGNSFTDRSVNQYISTGHYQVTEPDAIGSSITFQVYGGDTFVNYYDDEMLEQYWSDLQNYKDVYLDFRVNKLSIAVCGPCESRINTDYRAGSHWADSRDGSNMPAYVSTIYTYNEIWSQQNTAAEKFFAKDFAVSYATEHPHRLWASEIKINGELVDSWRSFKIANSIDVDGIYGPINRIISHKEQLFFYQATGFGIASIDEKSVIQDESGQSLVLGVGGVFPDYQYISTNTGTNHQFSVIATDNGIYHYDSRLNKMMKYAGGALPLSDIKGMSSFFDNELSGAILGVDKTTRSSEAVGVHATKDLRYNRLLFTFLKYKEAENYTTYETDTVGEFTFATGNFFEFDGTTYQVVVDITVNEKQGPFDPTNNPDAFKEMSNSVTIGYNEALETYTFFYDYLPTLYLEYGRKLLSVSPYAKNKLYEHNVGEKGYYYDTIRAKSTLDLLLPGGGESISKVYNNLNFYSQVTDSSDVDIYNETINRIRFFNDYQDTGVIELTPDSNIKRRMRQWRMQIPRDKDTPLSRMRNPWLRIQLEYDNTEDKKCILHDIMYSFTPTKY